MGTSLGDNSVVEIDVFLPYYNTPRFLDHSREIAASFNMRHPRHKVRIHECNVTVAQATLERAVQEGKAPAIAQFPYTSFQLAREMVGVDGRPFFSSVERAVAGRTEILGEPVTQTDVIPAVRDYYTCDGELTSVPTLASTLVMFANMDMLKAAGIRAMPRTWSEIDVACETISRLPDAPPYAITWPSFGWMFLHALGAEGVLVADHDNGRSGPAEHVYLASEEMLAYVKWWQHLHKRGHYLYTSMAGLPLDDPAKIWDDNVTAFASQQVAFCLSSSVDSERMVQAGQGEGFSVRVGHAPYSGRVPYCGSAIGGDSLWLSADLDEATRDGALAFIQFLNDARNAAERHVRSGYLPVTMASVDLLDDEGWFAARPHRRAAVDQLLTGRGAAQAKGALIGVLPSIYEVLVAAMHDVLANGADPETRLAQANADGQRLLDAHNARLRASAQL